MNSYHRRFDGSGGYDYHPPGYHPAPPPVDQRTDAYVARAHPQCQDRGCQYATAAGLLEAAGQALTEGNREHMSQALWCDQGGHAFSERDPGRQRISVEILDDSGTEHSQFRDLCGDCAKTAGLLNPARTRPAALTPVPGTAQAGHNDDI